MIAADAARPAPRPPPHAPLEGALAHAARGRPIFPCGADKRPLTAHGFKDATTDPEQIQEWWGRWPTALIGMPTGAPSRVFVLDVDVDPASGKDGETSLLSLMNDRGPLPDTVESLTPRGGRHLFFRHPGGTVPCSASKIGPDLDIRGDGGYVVLPPSRLPDGRAYHWEGSSDPDEGSRVAAPPDWLVALVTGPSKTGEAPASPRGTDGAIVPEGGRNATLASLAGTMRRRGMTGPAILAALLAENEARCRPPLHQDEVAKIAASVERYAPARGEASLTPPHPEAGDPGPTGETYHGHSTEDLRRKAAEPKMPRIITAADLGAMVFAEPRWAVPDLLPEGLGILAGRPKMGKSWLALAVGAAVASGGHALGKIRVSAGDVLYLALEDRERRLKSRLDILLDDAAFPERLHFATTWPRGDAGASGIRLWLDDHRDARLIVVDTLARFREPDKGKGSAYAGDYDALSGLQSLAIERRVCILLIHHLRKMAADDPMDTISGTLGITGACDAVLVLARERGAADAVLHITGRDIEDAQHALKWDAPTCLWTILGDAAAVRVSQERRDILALLAGGPAYPKGLAEALGKPRGTVRKLLHGMVHAGEVATTGDLYHLPTGNTGNRGNGGNTGNRGNTPSEGLGAACAVTAVTAVTGTCEVVL